MTDIAADPIGDPRQFALRKRIATACHGIRIAAVIWIAWTLGLIIYYWSDRAAFVARLAKAYELDAAAFAVAGYWSAFVLVLFDWCISAALVYALWRLTRGYLDGEVLTAGAARRLKTVAFAGFAAAGFDILARPIEYWLLAPGLLFKIQLAGWLRPSDLLYAIICSFLLGLAVILGAAAEIAEDNAGIV